MQAYGRDADAGDLKFRELADSAPVMIWRSGPDTLCDWFNKPWLDFVGRDMEREIGDGWADGVHPEDSDRCNAVYRAAFEAREAFSMEYRLKRHDGEYRWLLDHGAPYQRNGVFAGFCGSCVDVTTMKRAQDHQRLMLDETDHRVKNALSIVQSLAQQSFGTAAAGSVAGAFVARLQAFANAHDLLARGSWKDALLEDVLRKVLMPWCGPDGRCVTSGPTVTLPPRTAVTFAIAMHELCVNAVKFGALSNETGRVRITWTTLAAPAPQFLLDWREDGGPSVAAPAHRGFGMRMVERALASELRAEIAMDFEPGGLVCSIRAPLPNEAITVASP